MIESFVSFIGRIIDYITPQFVKDWLPDFIINFMNDFFGGIITLLLTIFVIIIAILISVEILKVLKVLDFINGILYKVFRYLGISKSASMPLFIGLISGITYGAGMIIASYNEKEMTKDDVILVSVFMCICHAIIEDTIIFATMGANPYIILFGRLILAIVVTIIARIILNKKNNKIKGENQTL